MTAVAPVEPSAAPPAAPTPAPADGFAEALRGAVTGGAVTGGAVAGGAALRQRVTLGEYVGGAAGVQPGWATAQMGAVDTLGASSGLQLAGAGGVTLLAGADGGQGTAVVEAATRYLGVPYRWGGTNPATGLDCSGFVQRAFADLGIALPRVSVDQAKQGTAVASLAEAQPGDLVFWRGSPNHIGIYAGDGQMLVAPRTGDVVKYQKISRTPHEIRRIV